MNKEKISAMEIAFIVIIILALIGGIAFAIKYTIDNKNIAKYNSKIQDIEASARRYGIDNKGLILKGVTKTNDNPSTITIKNNVFYTINKNKKFEPDEKLNDNEYRGNYISVSELVNEGYYKWDKEDQCSNCTDENKQFYNNIVISPLDNSIINECYVYIYYKKGEIYAHFDIQLCNQTIEKPGLHGKQYKQIENK